MTEEEYYVTDKEIAILLISKKLPVLKTDKDEFNKTRFFFTKSEASVFVTQYQRGELAEFENIMRALSLFNSIIHSRG